MSQTGRFGVGSATALVVANMVGTGVFTSLGFQLASVPSGFAILLLWVAGGVVSLAGALCYAEVVTQIPGSGGEYHLLSRLYHPRVGWMAAWISMVAGFAAPIALCAMALDGYARGLGLPLAGGWMGALSLCLIALLLCGPHRWLSHLLGSLTLIKVLLIVAVITSAWIWGQADLSLLLPKRSDLPILFSADFVIAWVFVMYAFTGWNAASYVAGELNQPERTVPRALIGGTCVVTLLYLGVNAAFLTCVPWDQMEAKPEVALAAAQVILGPEAGRVMGGMIGFGLLSMITGMTWAGSRVYQKVGQDDSRLAVLALNNRYQAPWVAILLQLVLSLTLLFSGTYESVLTYVESLLVLCSLLVVVGVFRLRSSIEKNETKHFRMPWYPWPPLIFIAAMLGLLSFLVVHRTQTLMWAAGTLVLGWLLTVLMQRSR